MNRIASANLLALLAPAALLGGAFGFEHIGGLAPCEMCIWQRWPHAIAILLALAAFVPALSATRRPLVALAALAIAVSGGIGIFHAGVEQHWWQGITTCAAAAVTGSTTDILNQVMAMPLVRCDAIPWSLFGISMAGWNAIVSLGTAGMILWLIRKP